jgi:hypothetical protein
VEETDFVILSVKIVLIAADARACGAGPWHPRLLWVSLRGATDLRSQVSAASILNAKCYKKCIDRIFCFRHASTRDRRIGISGGGIGLLDRHISKDREHDCRAQSAGHENAKEWWRGYAEICLW